MKKIKIEKPKKEKKLVNLAMPVELYSVLLNTAKQNGVTLTYLINELLKRSTK